MSKSTESALLCLNTRQMNALIWRYVIILKKSYISTTGRMFLWPLVMLTLIQYALYRVGKVKYNTKDLAIYVPTLSVMITLFQVHHSLNILISDRASGFRALMMIMGLKRGSYYAANFLCFSVCICVSTVAIAFIFGRNIFIDSEASLLDILGLFLLFGIHLSALIFFIASLLSSTIISGLLVFGALLIDPLYHTTIVGIASGSSDTLRPIILFVASIIPFESIHLFADSYIVCLNCNFSQEVQDSNLTGKVSQSTNLILASIIFWSLVTFLLAFWIDQVCPWTADLPHKNSLFCLNLFKKAPKDQSIPMDDSFYETSNQFERTNIAQPIGISIANVTKKFNQQVIAVDSLSFNIHRGETTLLLGHNGAGKTTLMNMIFGKLIPDSGSITVNQLSGLDDYNESIGVCMQNNVLDEGLTVRQHLELFADIKDSSMDQLERKRHIESTIDDVGLTGHSNKLPGELSGGMKRKLSLAMAFVGKSSVLILDEPSSGLDPDSRIFVWDAIRRYRANRTVLLSTQHMEEADYLGDRIAIMKAGKIICCGSSSFLNKLVGFRYRLRIECNAYHEQVLSFIREYFEEATVENDFSGDVMSNPSTSNAVEEFSLNMVVMLKSSKTQDPEVSLISLLEELELNMKSHHIRSFGLKSSSIEDVMLQTAESDREKYSATSTSDVSIDFKKQPVNTIDPKLLKSPKRREGSDSELHILKALLYKQLHTYQRNILKIVFYRLILATAGIYWLVTNVPNSSYTVGSINTLMIIHFIFYPSQEKVFKFKSIQLSSDANFLVYWFAQFLIDLFSVIYLMICIDVLLMRIIDSSRVEAISFEVRVILSVGIGLVAVSALLLAYVISTSIRSTRSAISIYLMPFVSSVILNFLTKFAPMLFIGANAILTIINKFTETFFIATLPTDSMAYIIYGLHSKCYIKRRNTPCFETPGTSPVALGFTALIGQIFLFSLLLYLIEFRLSNISNICQLGNCLCSMITRNRRRDMSTRVEDADVKAEATKVMQVIERPDINSTSLVAADLSKSYRRNVKVIDDLWFKVGKGECFGLLGVNGAGKSTTFSMLAAECRPDRGRVWLSGHYLADNVNSYRRNLGFDPQTSPEELHLTCEEALFLMARLRKVEETAIPSLVMAILEALDMRQHANKIARELSGGTLRKLSLGMSIIGNPDLLLLDEPTAGVDPVARRGIWRLLRSLCSQNNTSIVIASHAMEECEAICDRISIMARGKLRCVGSFLHLRNKFSQSCSLRVHFSGQGELSHTGGGRIPTHMRTISQLSELLNSIFGPHIKLTDSNINSVTYNISDESFKRSLLFKTLREFRIRSQGQPNMSYLINDSSLEDIFIELAQEQSRMK